MSGWRRLYAKPAGSLPGGIVTQWGIGIITVGVLIVMTFYIYLGDGGEEEPFAAGQAPGENVAGSFDNQVAAQVEQEQQRADARRDAAERELLSQQQGNLRAGQVSPNTAAAMAQAGNSPDTGEPYTEEEWELRERLRLEALERRSRSLRSLPVAQTYRQSDGGAFPTMAAPQSGAADDPLAAIRTEEAEALSNVMSTIEGVTANLEDEIAAEAQADQAFIAALRGEAPPADPFATVAPVAAVPPAIPVQRDYTDPPRIGAQEDPPGWERIHEGSFLEAALVTQLSGDFPGPVLGCRFRAVLFGGPAAGVSPARGAGDRHGGSRGEPGSIAAGREFPSAHPARWTLGVSGISRTQSSGRGCLERSSQPSLLLDVCRCRRCGCPQWSNRRQGESLRRRCCRFSGRSQPGTR